MTRFDRSKVVFLGALVLVGLAACSETVGPDVDEDLPLPDLVLEEVVSGIGAPTHLTAPEGDRRLFVSEIRGRVFVVEDGSVLPTPFLDVSSRVSREGEQGFFGVAFHPDYETNGHLFVSYTDLEGANRFERYQVSEDRNVADPASAQLILRVPQPTANHNGGHLSFGPDGMLYISIGDGGFPRENAQDLENLLGSILRIDVDSGDPYAIPANNPFVDDPSARAEIWAYGLRNPWRFSVDPQTNLMYIADVGETHREEVNVVALGGGGYNFGWNRMEGSSCFPPEVTGCDQAGVTLPAFEYPHITEDPNGGRSIIGGYVYRGEEIPGLRGHYVFGDFIGWVGSFRYRDGEVADERRWDFDIPNDLLVLSIGKDGFGELYVLSHVGRIFKIVEAPG